MKILYRYIIKEFLKPLFFSAAVFGIIVLISEFFRELSFYMENKTSFMNVIVYLLLNLPWWIIQALPVAVLLAVLFSLGQMARQGEITAVKAAGINLWRVLFVLFFCGAAIGGGEIFLREAVIPATVQKAEALKKEKIHKDKKQTRSEFRNMVVALPPDGRMTIGYLNTAQNVIRLIVIDYYDADFNIARQIVAQEGIFSNGKWLLRQGVERTYPAGVMQERYFTEEPVSLNFHPRDLVLERLRPEQMSSGDYLRYVRQLENLGIPTEKERLQFQQRWSSAFSYIIVMLIGVPFALGLGSRHGKLISFTFALVFAFIYWGFQAVGQSLGENRVLSPFAAAWLANFVFGVSGFYLLTKVRK